MITILKTPCADRDLDFIWLRIARHSLINANNIIEAIEQKMELLRLFPDGGTDCPELGDNIPRLVSGDYLIYFLHQEQSAIILRILDGRNKIGPEMFGGRE